jgi:hypothetical protein
MFEPRQGECSQKRRCGLPPHVSWRAADIEALVAQVEACPASFPVGGPACQGFSTGERLAVERQPLLKQLPQHEPNNMTNRVMMGEIPDLSFHLRSSQVHIGNDSCQI